MDFAGGELAVSVRVLSAGTGEVLGDGGEPGGREPEELSVAERGEGEREAQLVRTVPFSLALQAVPERGYGDSGEN